MKIPSKIFNPKNHKSIAEIIFDSMIIAGFASLSVIGNNLPTAEKAFIALKAGGLAFFAQVAYEKGIKKLTQKKK